MASARRPGARRAAVAPVGAPAGPPAARPRGFVLLLAVAPWRGRRGGRRAGNVRFLFIRVASPLY